MNGFETFIHILPAELSDSRRTYGRAEFYPFYQNNPSFAPVLDLKYAPPGLMGRGLYGTGKTWRKQPMDRAISQRLPNDALPRQDRLGDARGHLLVPVDERHQEPQVLLGAAEVIAEG